jgi:hypothetical protein
MTVSGTTVALSSLHPGDNFVVGTDVFILSDGASTTAGNFLIVRLSDGKQLDSPDAQVTHIPFQANPI